MNYYPSGEERDYRGVCCICGKMTGTIVIDKLSEQRKRELKEFYNSLGLEADNRDSCDFREVTACCGAEDFIPITYAVKCKKCDEWIDRRFGKRRGEFYVCPICIDRS